MVAEWSVGLFNCLDDFDICCLTCWCPCVTFGRIAEIADKGSTACCVSGTMYVCLSLLCCHWLYYFPKRSAMRSQYNLQEWPFMDWYVHLHYLSCALCQEYRELENRGFNMAKGWKGSNKFVGCVHGMKAPVKQAMCF